MLEDVYRSLLFWERDGVVVRLTGYCDDTDYRAAGGIQARITTSDRKQQERAIGKQISEALRRPQLLFHSNPSDELPRVGSTFG